MRERNLKKKVFWKININSDDQRIKKKNSDLIA